MMSDGRRAPIPPQTQLSGSPDLRSTDGLTLARVLLDGKAVAGIMINGGSLTIVPTAGARGRSTGARG